MTWQEQDTILFGRPDSQNEPCNVLALQIGPGDHSGDMMSLPSEGL